MLRLIKAGLVGGVILFAWYSVSWTVMDWHKKTFTSLPFGDVIIQSILEGNQNLNPDSRNSKIYIAPKVIDMNNKEEGYDQSAFAFIALSPNGLKPMNDQIIFSILTQTALALIMSLILIIINSSNFFKLYTIVILSSVLFAIGSSLPANNWWGFASDYLFIDALDLLIAWSLAGIPIAFFSKAQID
jgi:hypothetical protein